MLQLHTDRRYRPKIHTESYMYLFKSCLSVFPTKTKSYLIKIIADFYIFGHQINCCEIELLVKYAMNLNVTVLYVSLKGHYAYQCDYRTI